MPHPPSVEAVRSVIVGLASGEAYGLLSSLTGEAAAELRPLLVGDEAVYGAVTEESVILAEVIADNCGFNPDAYARRLAERADVDNPLRLYSLSTAEHIMLVRRGYSWLEARSMVASLEPPLDAVARAAVIPLFYTKERLVAEMASAQVLATSLDRRASVAARAYALTLYYILNGLPVAEAVEEAASQTPKQALRDSLYTAIDAVLQAPRRVADIVSMPGDDVAQLLASAVAAPLMVETGSTPLEALRVTIAAAPRQAAHVAAAMAGALLAAAGSAPAPSARLEASKLIEAAVEKLSGANRSCRGLDTAEAYGSIAG